MRDDSSERRDAKISECRSYRYWLSREWSRNAHYKCVCFIGLNPSTADAMKDDATVRLWRGFAKRWGYGGFWAVNLYAFRTTFPSELFRADDPVGPENDARIIRVARRCDLVVACWGNHAKPERVRRVVKMLRNRELHIHCLRETKTGNPSHPRGCPGDLSPQRWPIRGGLGSVV